MPQPLVEPAGAIPLLLAERRRPEEQFLQRHVGARRFQKDSNEVALVRPSQRQANELRDGDVVVGYLPEPRVRPKARKRPPKRPDGPVPLTNWPDGNPTAYVLGQLNGTLRVLSASLPSPQLASFTERVVAANNWQHRPETRPWLPAERGKVSRVSTCAC